MQAIFQKWNSQPEVVEPDEPEITEPLFDENRIIESLKNNIAELVREEIRIGLYTWSIHYKVMLIVAQRFQFSKSRLKPKSNQVSRRQSREVSHISMSETSFKVPQNPVPSGGVTKSLRCIKCFWFIYTLSSL